MNNLNFKENPITSISGLLLMVVSLAMFVTPMFVEVIDLPETYVTAGIGVVGTLLLLSPDTLLGIIKKKTDTDGNKTN